MNNMGCGVVIHTKKIKEITPTSAESGGEGIITSDPILEKGIIWGTDPDKLTINTGTKIVEGQGSQPFTTSITGLIPSSVYYVKAYATTLCCTIYGESREFKTDSMAVEDGCLYVSYSIPPKASFVVPAGYEIVSVTDKTYLVSNCITDMPVDVFKCYGINICQTGNHVSGLELTTQNYESIHYVGLIIKGVRTPFTEEVVIDTNDTQDDRAEAMNAGIDNLIAAIQTMPLFLGGQITALSRCDADSQDEEEGGGVCGVLKFKTMVNIGTDLRLYGYITPQGEHGEDTLPEVQFPAFTKQQLYDQQQLTICNCPEEEIVTES